MEVRDEQMRTSRQRCPHALALVVRPRAGVRLGLGDPYQDQLWTLTHYDFLRLVEKAESESDKTLAYGFASHNESWDADETAHVSAINQPGSGYVARKSDTLAATLKPQVRLFLLLSGVSNPDTVVDDVLPTVAHSDIETAVDLLVSRNEDPDIGQRLLMAARTRGWSAPILLCKAYAADLAVTVTQVRQELESHAITNPGS
jgi:hypothetical protein